MAPKSFQPTKEQRAQVERATAVGLTNEQVSKVLGISETTLKKYFADELATGGPKANMNVAAALYQSAMRGNVTAQIFWCKTRLGWREVDRHEITGKDGSNLIVNVAISRKVSNDKNGKS